MTWWAVSVNNGQKDYVIEAERASDAACDAELRWATDASDKQLKRGVYALLVRTAKFSEVRDQPVMTASVPV